MINDYLYILYSIIHIHNIESNNAMNNNLHLKYTQYITYQKSIICIYIPYINLSSRSIYGCVFFIFYCSSWFMASLRSHTYTEKELIHNQDKCVVITADLDGFPVVIIWRHVAEVPLE